MSHSKPMPRRKNRTPLLAARSRRRYIGECLETRSLLAADVSITILPSSEDPGLFDVTFRVADGATDPLRLELRGTAGALWYRVDGGAESFDLDSTTDGVQSLAPEEISRVFVELGGGADTLVLDERAALVAQRGLGVEGDGGSDRVEIYSSSTTVTVALDVAAGRIDLDHHDPDGPDFSRSVSTSAIEAYHFLAPAAEQRNLVVRTGSAAADRLEWRQGTLDVWLGPNAASAEPTRITYFEFDTTWLLAGDGADTITLRDYRGPGRPGSTPHLNVGAQEGDDVVQLFLMSDRASTHYSFDTGSGTDEVDVRSYAGERERFEVYGTQIRYYDEALVMALEGASPENHVLVIPGVVDYDDVEKLHLSTGGGDDTIVVDQRHFLSIFGDPQPFPAEVAIEAQDDNDAIEINVALRMPHAIFRIDGGGGTNGLTQYVRPQPLGEANGVIAPRDETEVAIRLEGNELLVNYFNPGAMWTYTSGPSADDFDEDTITEFDNVIGLTVVSYENGKTRVLDTQQEDLPSSVRILLASNGQHVTLPLLPGVSNTRWSIESNAAFENQLQAFTGDGHDSLTIHSQELTARTSTSGGLSAPVVVAHQGVELSLGTAGGNDTVTIQHAAALLSLTLSTWTGDDRIELIMTQSGTSLANIDAIYAGDGEDDLLTVRDAPGNNLDLVLVESDPAAGDLEIGGVNRFELYAADGDDRFTNNTNVPTLVDGGAGNDTLVGGSGADRLYGSDGIDQLLGRGGNDFLFADYDPLSNLFALSDELLDGGSGDDLLVTRAIDQVIASEGNDRVQDFLP